MRKIQKLVIMLSLVISTITPISSMAAWNQVRDRWQYEEDGKMVGEGWITDNQESYYIGADGYMKAGWLKLTDTWYFLNTVHDGTYGKMLTGWQWVDGYCYYFKDDGEMLVYTMTPDGFAVNESGAWSIEGATQYVPGKGIITAKSEDTTVIRSSGGGGSSGGGSGGSGGSSGSRPQNTVLTYTIQYVDIKTKAVLQIVTGQGQKSDTIKVDFPDIKGYELCSDQKEEFTLISNNQTVKIYYEQKFVASPSDAQKVSWKVYFVEEGNSSKEIFKSQEGKSLEDTELTIDFPEVIINNGIYYTALIESPYRIVLSGSGTQIFYIEFSGKEQPEEPDPEAPATEKLERWLALSRIADKELSGITSMNGQLITESAAESNQRLKNLVSMTDDTERHEIYLIAKNHEPSSFSLGQMAEVSSVSEIEMDRFYIGEDEFIILKIGFQVLYEEAACTHNFKIENDVESGCLTNGIETVLCTKCGYEESVVIPATGHQDADGDGICDICQEETNGSEIPEGAYYEIGDLQARKIGKKIYLFRCIDEDYEDGLNNKQAVALFLCEQVIRSDIESTSSEHKSMTFGSNNNYKSSTVRSWLKRNATDSLFGTYSSYTGISLAYTGMTAKGSYEEFDDTSLIGRDKSFQLLEDNIFLLSVEEAVKYSEYLWKFGDTDVNNPESQYSAYSKGYWLRTPQYKESSGQFAYGSGVYIVDLVDGNIRPVEVNNKAIGIRPAITVPQEGDR